jgi:hypothetical protein
VGHRAFLVVGMGGGGGCMARTFGCHGEGVLAGWLVPQGPSSGGMAAASMHTAWTANLDICSLSCTLAVTH